MWAGAVPGRQETLVRRGGVSESRASREVYTAAEHTAIYRCDLLSQEEGNV